MKAWQGTEIVVICLDLITSNNLRSGSAGEIDSRCRRMNKSVTSDLQYSDLRFTLLKNSGSCILLRHTKVYNRHCTLWLCKTLPVA